jgi:hypothetical protein
MAGGSAGGAFEACGWPRATFGALWPASRQKWHRLCGPFALDASFDLHGKASSERQYSHLAHNSEALRACTTRRC